MSLISRGQKVGTALDIFCDRLTFKLQSDSKLITVNSFVVCYSNEKCFVFKVTEIRGSLGLAEAAFFVSIEEGKIKYINKLDIVIGQDVYLLENIGAVENLFNLSSPEQLSLECFMVSDLNVLIKIPFDSFFSKHFGIFGSTGSGKSWSVARLIEECQKYNPKIILVDPAGEYKNFRKCISLGLGDEDCHGFTLPYYDLIESDLFNIFQPIDGVHFAKLKSAIKTLKLAYLEPTISVGGLVIKANREKKDFNRLYQKRYVEVENDQCKFEILKLPVQVQNECVFPQQSPTDSNYWGGINSSELAICAPFIGKIESIINDPDLSFIFKPDKKLPSLIEIIQVFLNQNSKQILRISLANFPTAFGVREIFVNTLGRFLFNLAHKGVFQKHPLLFIIDEAHNFVSEHSLKFVKTFGLSSLENIVKQSRKFSLLLGLASQQVREISPLIISQLGCMLIHRLNDPEDFEIVRPLIASNEIATQKILANLKTGEALLAGVEFEKSVLVKVLPPKNKPNSLNANFTLGWSSSSNSNPE